MYVFYLEIDQYKSLINVNDLKSRRRGNTASFDVCYVEKMNNSNLRSNELLNILDVDLSYSNAFFSNFTTNNKNSIVNNNNSTSSNIYNQISLSPNHLFNSNPNLASNDSMSNSNTNYNSWNSNENHISLSMDPIILLKEDETNIYDSQSIDFSQKKSHENAFKFSNTSKSHLTFAKISSHTENVNQTHLRPINSASLSTTSSVSNSSESPCFTPSLTTQQFYLMSCPFNSSMSTASSHQISHTDSRKSHLDVNNLVNDSQFTYPVSPKHNNDLVSNDKLEKNVLSHRASLPIKLKK